MKGFLNAFVFVVRIITATLKPRPDQRIWQWIDEHVSIPVITGSPNPGPLKTERFPVYRALYELLQLPHVHFFSFCASARVGKTLLSINYILWSISESPGPILWLDPTRKTALRFVRQELEPFIRECPPVWEKAVLSKTTWTALEKEFRGLQLRIVGSGSAADLAGYQAMKIVLNESDRLRAVVDREAASADLAVERSKQFEHTRMIIRNSTPTREDGDIWQNFLLGSQLYCYVRCPHCQARQRLTFWPDQKDVPFDPEGFPIEGLRTEQTGRVRFDQFKIIEPVEVEPGKFEQRERGYDIERVRADATYECASCKKDIEHFELNGLLADAEDAMTKVFAELRTLIEAGEQGNVWQTLNRLMAESGANCIWLAHNIKAPADNASAHLSALYSPFERWGALAVKFVLARGSLSKLVSFHCLDLGIPFVHQSATIKDSDLDRVIARCPKKYLKRQLPFEPIILTMTVDVQGFGFFWSIRAHGVLWEHQDKPFWSALLDWGEAVSWEQIEEFAGLREDKNGEWNRYRWRCEDGTIKEFSVTAGLIDSGFETQQNKNVYEFCARWSDVFSPSKGGDQSKTRGATIRLAPVMNDSLDLVWYWDSFFKQGLYYHCIKTGMNGAGEPLYWFLPADIDELYRNHLKSERLEGDGDKRAWVQRGPCDIADTEKLHEVLRDKIWELLEAAVEEAEKLEDAAGHEN